MSTQRYIRSSLTVAALLAAIAGGPASALADQSGSEWLEQPSFADAGETPGAAQTALGSGPMTFIRGQVSLTDADVYRVFIPDFSLFSATTSGNGTTADTQLFLFTDAGIGIACNDDTASGNPRSTLPLGSALYAGYGPGNYLIAITRFNHDPVSAGGPIFTDTPVTGVYGPAGPGGSGALIGWAGGSGVGNSSYAITLTGVEFVPATPPDTAPTAVAGPDQSIHASGTVSLDGSASFDDNTASASLIYSWSFVSVPSGSAAVLATPNAAQTTFVADYAGSYVVQLVVEDSLGQLSPPSLVTVSSTNLAPTANAGSNQSVIVGDSVTLDGTASTDPENDPLTYQWTLSSVPAGSVAALTGDTTSNPQFIPDLPGSYIVDLIVDDGLGPSLSDSVEIVAVTGAEFAENAIMSAQAAIAALPPSSVTNRGNQRVMSIFLTQAINAIQHGHYGLARLAVEAVVSRTDGCPLRGSPDAHGWGRDWITTCDDQTGIYDQLQAALNALPASSCGN